MKNKTYTIYEDPGHGWVAVPMHDLVALEVADKITGYSYLIGDMAYLEEDWDMSVFLLAFREKFGKFPDFKQKYQEVTMIRNYPNYDYKEVA